MPRRTIGAFVAVALLLAVPVIAGASGSATPPHPASPVIAGASGSATAHPAPPIWIGAQVSPTENVYDVRTNGGRLPQGVPLRGAAIQFVRENSAGTGGTDTATTYFGTATVVTAGAFTNSTPNANGIVTFRERGRYVRGTGFYKGIRGTYRASWTLNTKNGQLKLVVTSYLRNRP